MDARHRIRTSCLLTLFSGAMLIGLGPTADAAESEATRSGFSIGPRFAVIDPKDDRSRQFGGVQARLHLGRVFGIEASVDARRDRFEGSTKVWTVPVQVSALLYLIPDGPISPFLLAGPGWYYTKVEGPGDFNDTQQRFGLHAGGGLQWFLSRHVSIDGTYRYLWVEDVASKDAALRDKKFDDSGHMFTVGLNFHF